MKTDERDKMFKDLSTTKDADVMAVIVVIAVVMVFGTAIWLILS